MADWSPKEDRRPAASMPPQPRVTPKGRVWTQLTRFEIGGVQSYTHLVIREEGDQFIVDHGRIWPVVVEEEDGA